VSNLETDNGVVSFFYRGDINQITSVLSKHKVTDLTIEEPTLEEIFMHYYE
jgi:ABC-2 type transport system ATP-binding protein